MASSLRSDPGQGLSVDSQGFRIRRWRAPLELRWEQLVALRRFKNTVVVWHQEDKGSAVRRTNCSQLAGERLQSVVKGWRQALEDRARSERSLVCHVVPQCTRRDRIVSQLLLGGLAIFLASKVRHLATPLAVALFNSPGIALIDLVLPTLVFVGGILFLFTLAAMAHASSRGEALRRRWTSIRLDPRGVHAIGADGAKEPCRVEVTEDGVLLSSRGRSIPVELLSKAPLAADLAVALAMRFQGSVRRRSSIGWSAARLPLLWGPLSIVFVAWLGYSANLLPPSVALYTAIGIEIAMLVMAGLLLWLERAHARLAQEQIDSGPELLASIGW